MPRSSNCSSKYFSRVATTRGLSNVCSNFLDQNGTTFSPRTMLNARKIQLNLLKEREQKYVFMYKNHEVATELNVSMATINRLIARGQLNTVKFGRCIRVTEQQLQDFISSKEVN